jgi:hypothetical protein
MKLSKAFYSSVYLIILSAQSLWAQTVIPLRAPAAPIGLVATPTQLFYSQPFCQSGPGTRVINVATPPTFVPALFATLPDEPAVNLLDQDGTCAENYFAISSGAGTFLPYAGYVFVSSPVGLGTKILRYPPTGGSVFSIFATTPGGGNHAAATFDTVGTFQNALIITGKNGVIGYNASGAVLFIYPNPDITNTFLFENATVVPMSYAACPGCMLIAADNVSDPNAAGKIYSLPPGALGGTIPTVFSTAPNEPEALSLQGCALGGYSYFVSGYHNYGGGPPVGVPISTDGAILAYTSALLPSAGTLMFPDELSGKISGLSAPNVFSSFSTTGYQLEGATTVPCAPVRGCTLTQGGYKNHFNGKILPLTLGTVSYTAAQIDSIMQNNAIKGNGLLSLAHQLITAKLNVIYGAAPDAATQTAINSADTLIGSLVVPPVGSGSLSAASTSALETILDTFNNRGPECTN